MFTTLAEDGCEKMVAPFVLAMLAGIFFILVGFYWISVFWWVKVSGSASKRVSFSFLTALWFILALLFVGIAAALATEVFEYRRILASFKKDRPCDDDMPNVPKVPYHFNIIPLLALASMVVLWVVHVCVFLVHAVRPKK